MLTTPTAGRTARPPSAAARARPIETDDAPTDQDAALRAFGRALRRSSRLAQATLDAALSKSGLSFAQWSTLRLVNEAGEITVGELAREIEMTSGAMTRLVDGLEARFLVRRDRSGNDRRLVQVTATDAAGSVAEAGSTVVATVWAELLLDFEPQEVAAITGLLSKLVAALQAHAAAHSPVVMEFMS